MFTNLPDVAYKVFWTAVAAALAGASTATIDVGPAWTPIVAMAYTGLLVKAREWVGERLARVRS